LSYFQFTLKKTRLKIPVDPPAQRKKRLATILHRNSSKQPLKSFASNDLEKIFPLAGLGIFISITINWGCQRACRLG
jgi:hypothetical protein